MSVISGPVRETVPSARLVAANPNLRRINLALAGSMIGDWAYNTAIVVWLYENGGPAYVGGYAVVRLLLIALGVPFLSALVDRLPKKAFLITTDLLRAGLVQGKTVFEPNLESSAPGVIVAYRIEARDNDAISAAQAAPVKANARRAASRRHRQTDAQAGRDPRPAPGKPGSSRTLYVVIQDPRENLDEQLLREREVLDKLIENLADRLEALESGRPGGRRAPVHLPGASWRCGWRCTRRRSRRWRRWGGSSTTSAGRAARPSRCWRRCPPSPTGWAAGCARSRRCWAALQGPVGRGDAGGIQLRPAVQARGPNTPRSWRRRC